MVTLVTIEPFQGEKVRRGNGEKQHQTTFGIVLIILIMNRDKYVVFQNLTLV